MNAMPQAATCTDTAATPEAAAKWTVADVEALYALPLKIGRAHV